MKNQSSDLMSCRLCSSRSREVINIGSSPAANNFNDSEGLEALNAPLVVDFCDKCRCIQLRDCLDEEFLYSHYTYMTPDIKSLTKHYLMLINYLSSKSFLNDKARCLEIGSNTGLFLQKLRPRVSSVLGVDPAENISKIANELGVETIQSFFNVLTSKEILRKKSKFDLVIARHMFAHNSDPKDMLEGINALLSSKGIIMIENAYAIPTLLNGEFDQIYHAHMFYYTVQSMNNLLEHSEFELIDLLDSSLHGGSIVFFAARKKQRIVSNKIEGYLEEEERHFNRDKIFINFNNRIKSLRDNILAEINKDLNEKKLVGAYGATAKSFTMFSYLELDHEKISYCIDTTPTKIGKFFPHFDIKVISEEEFKQNPVDTLLVTAWNYKNHIIAKSKSIFPKGTKLIFPLPTFEIYIV